MTAAHVAPRACAGASRGREALEAEHLTHGADGPSRFDISEEVGSKFRLSGLRRQELVQLSRKVQRRLHRRERMRSKVDDLARTLCELEVGRHVPAHQAGVDWLSQVEATHAAELVSALGAPPVDLTPQGAFNELQGTLDYVSERCDLAPFDIGQLSLPRPSFRPRPLSTLLSAEETLDVERELHDIVLAKSDSEVRMRESGLTRAYSDPALRCRRTRARLVRRLLESGLVELSSEDGVRVGVFAVWKSNKTQQRLIIDARVSNMCFSDLVNPDLPIGASFSRLFLEESETFECSSGDRKDAFYTLALPEHLRCFFVLEPIRPRDLAGSFELLEELKRCDWLYPRFCAVPMGWSHAVNLCQRIVRSLVLRGQEVVP